MKRLELRKQHKEHPRLVTRVFFKILDDLFFIYDSQEIGAQAKETYLLKIADTAITLEHNSHAKEEQRKRKKRRKR